MWQKKLKLLIIANGPELAGREAVISQPARAFILKK